MNVQSKISFLLASFMLTSAFAAGPKGRRAQQEEQRIPTAVCAIQTETIAALPTKEIPRPNQNNSMVQLLRKIQAVMLYDHMTAKPAHMLTLKPLDTVVMIQDQPEYGGRAINYATKETAEFYMVTPIDALAGTEMFALVSRPDALEQGQVYIARYKHFLAIPEMGMNMAVLVDERRQNNHIFSRRATLVVGAQDGQASVSLNCNAGAGGRFTYSHLTRL